MHTNPLFLSLRDVCCLLDRAGIEYVLVGGLAVSIWGEPRATVDIDLLVLVDAEGISAFTRVLEESGSFSVIHKVPMRFERSTILRALLKGHEPGAEIMVDFLLVDDAFKRHVITRKQSVTVGDFTLAVATPEDTILMKLLSNRDQDLIDVKKMLESQRGGLDIPYMQQWAESLGVALPGGVGRADGEVK